MNKRLEYQVQSSDKNVDASYFGFDDAGAGDSSKEGDGEATLDGTQTALTLGSVISRSSCAALPPQKIVAIDIENDFDASNQSSSQKPSIPPGIVAPLPPRATATSVRKVPASNSRSVSLAELRGEQPLRSTNADVHPSPTILRPSAFSTSTSTPSATRSYSYSNGTPANNPVTAVKSETKTKSNSK